METDLLEALLAYPQFGISSASFALWVAGTAQPIADLPITATVATYYRPDANEAVSSWAWWSDGVWVGPRHTYADGSICAYEIEDLTWSRSDGLRTLLDMNSMWVARQIYLRAHDRWPGLQRIHTPLERLVQHREGKLCGCGRGELYARCCLGADLQAVPSASGQRARRNGVIESRTVTLPGTRNGDMVNSRTLKSARSRVTPSVQRLR